MTKEMMKHIAVLMGGISAERQISLASGQAIAKALEGRNYRVTRVDVTSEEFDLPGDLDLAFIALHGTYGEDGSVQSYLQKRGVPFTGADAESSRIAFDKLLSKSMFVKHGISSPRFEVLKAGQPRTLPLPVVVKPPRQGSSIGLSRVMREEEWAAAMEMATRYDDELLIEEFIPGRELTVGIVGEQVLPVIEIRAPQGNYDYTAKYTKGMTEYVCPAPLDEATTRRCQELAWKTFCVLGARGLGRVDVRLDDGGTPYVLELNTIPGFTETSLLPKAAGAIGISFADLCEKIVHYTLHHHA